MIPINPKPDILIIYNDVVWDCDEHLFRQVNTCTGCINCLYSVAQFCTSKDTLAHISGTPSNDDVMSYDSLKTSNLEVSLTLSSFKIIS